MAKKNNMTNPFLVIEYTKNGKTETNEYEKVKNNITAIKDPNSLVLLLGSFPGNQSLKKGIFFANGGNKFWKLLNDIYHNYPKKIDKNSTWNDQFDFLTSNKIALTDVLETCVKIQDSTKDEDILLNHSTINNEIINILNNCPKLERIGIMGKTAQRIFEDYLYERVKAKNPNIKIVYLPSTSGRNKTQIFNEYNNFLP